nr:putative lineage-restricted protein [Crepidula fornicata]
MLTNLVFVALLVLAALSVFAIDVEASLGSGTNSNSRRGSNPLYSFLLFRLMMDGDMNF